MDQGNDGQWLPKFYLFFCFLNFVLDKIWILKVARGFIDIQLSVLQPNQIFFSSFRQQKTRKTFVERLAPADDNQLKNHNPQRTARGKSQDKSSQPAPKVRALISELLRISIYHLFFPFCRPLFK